MTFSITKKRTERLGNLLLKEETPGDLRRKQRSANAISSEILSKVHEHITSYSTKMSLP